MFKRIIWFFIRMLAFIGILSLAALTLPRLAANLVTSPWMTNEDKAPQAPVAIVLGAGLQRDGTPSVILRDRLDTAIRLYTGGKVQKLLMSGDNRFVDYNEPGAMQAYAVSKGVPAEDVVLDYAGRRTYDTCYRARHIFLLERVIVVTQRFHLVRALFTCRMLGLDASGVPSDPRRYNPYWLAREFPATSVAFWELFISHPLPVLGEVEPIFPQPTAG